MGNSESRDGSENRESVSQDLTGDPRTQKSQRESQENTAPLHTAGYAIDSESNGDSRRSQSSTDADADDPLNNGSSLRGRLNPIGGGE